MLRSIENISHDKRPISDSVFQSPKKRQKTETDNCKTITAEIMLPSTILTEETSFSQILLNERVTEACESCSLKDFEQLADNKFTEVCEPSNLKDCEQLIEKQCDNNNNNYVQDDPCFQINKQTIESPCEPQSSTQKDLEPLVENSEANNERSCIDNFVEKNIISQIDKEENKTENETAEQKNTIQVQANNLNDSTQIPENLVNQIEKNIKQTDEQKESNSAEEEDEESNLSKTQEESGSTDEQEDQSSQEEQQLNLVYGDVDLLNLPGCNLLCLSKPTRYGCALARFLWSRLELANNRIVDPKSEQFNKNRSGVRPAYRNQIDLFKINLIKETIRIKFNLTGNKFLDIWEDVCKSINNAR